MLRGDKMAELREKKKNHVSAAREWLGKAEQSLDEENDIKGNLNLMLAQAELIKAREGKKKYKYGYRLVHCILVAGIIGLFFGFGTAGLREIKQPAPAVLPAALPRGGKSVEAALPLSPLTPEEKAALREDTRKETGAAFVRPPQEKAEAAVSQKMRQELPPEDRLAVTSAQMQQLVRAAGKSLRGQE